MFNKLYRKLYQVKVQLNEWNSIRGIIKKYNTAKNDVEENLEKRIMGALVAYKNLYNLLQEDCVCEQVDAQVDEQVDEQVNVEVRVGSPDGYMLDPSLYHTVGILKNVTIEILENDRGETSIGWYRQDNTEEVDEII